MSGEREAAMQLAITALLLAARRQGVHVDAICDGSIEWLTRTFGWDQRSALAATTIQRLAYEFRREDL